MKKKRQYEENYYHSKYKFFHTPHRETKRTPVRMKYRYMLGKQALIVQTACGETERNNTNSWNHN